MSKRLLDLFVATIGLLATSPIIAVIALTLLASRDGPVLFRQQRVGRGGTPFTILKFRTMRAPSPDASTITIGQDDRITLFGSFLRRTKLDELPQLWNVVRGDMSLVGPRPLLVRYLDRYTPDQARRHEVRPGVTGLAQVSGRNALTWDDKFAKDVEYVDNRSLVLDTKIIWRTFAQVIKRHGVAADGDVTMPEFLGSRRG